MPASPSPSNATIGQFFSSPRGDKSNNFNLLRFGAASAVILSHSILLSGDLANGSAWALGYMAVNCFFLISGFLVTHSLLSRNNLKHYCIARILRIYPALVVCVVLTILVIGLFDTTSRLGDFVSDPLTIGFWVKNTTLIAGEVANYLPTAFFSANPVKGQINAPLWTLQYEILVYAVLAMLFLLASLTSSGNRFTVLTRLIATVGIVTMVLFLLNITRNHPIRGIEANLVRFCALFFGGSLLYLFRNRIPLSHSALAVIGVAVLIGFARRELLIVVTYLSMGYVLLYLALIPAGPVRHFNRLGDYSYGLYIYAFPIQQGLVHAWPSIEPASLFLLSMSITLPVAMTSWHGLEKPFLRLKPARSTAR